MPNILALDTSSDYCSVSLYTNGHYYSHSELAPRSHTQLLLPMAKAIVDSHGLELNQLDAVAFGCGPGSFTGLRIAAGVAQGLAYGLGCSIYPVSNLKAMALQAYKKTGQKKVLVAIDARMNEVYWSVSQINTFEGHTSVATIGVEHVSTPESLVLADTVLDEQKGAAAKKESEGLVGIGSGFNFLTRLPLDVQQRISHIDASARPKADEVCELALHAYQQGQAGGLTEAMPSYIRDTVTWKKLPGRA